MLKYTNKLFFSCFRKMKILFIFYNFCLDCKNNDLDLETKNRNFKSNKMQIRCYLNPANWLKVNFHCVGYLMDVEYTWIL